MKVKLKSILKSSVHDFDCYGQQQIIFRQGNVLCIKQIGKNQSSFIYLNKNITQLYSFKPCTNKHGVFTAEKSIHGIEVALYNEKGERKSVSLSQQSPFFSQAEKIDLLPDDYDNSVVYGSVKGKEASCIFLCDFSKNKIIALGFMPFFEDIKVDTNENMTLSICGFNGVHNYRKSLRYGMNQWQTEEIIFKKIQPQHGSVIHHELLMGGRILMITRNSMYIFEDHDIIQIIQEQNSKIKLCLKIPHGILLVLSNQKIKLYVQDSDQVNLILKGQIKIDLQSDQEIYKMFLSFNNEEIVLRSNKNNVYVWKSQNISLQAGHSDLSFNRAQFSCNGQKDGNISIATGKKYCMFSGQKVVTLWNVEKNQFVLSSEINALSQHKRKPIITGAINPDGNSFMVAYQDKILIYKILLTKFKLFAQFPIKRCQNIIYSHGGQLVACKFSKGLNSSLTIINMIRLVELYTIKISCEPLQIIWNELDDQLIISTQYNFIQIYKIADSTRIHNVKFSEVIKYIRLDYKTRKLLVSSQNKISILQNGTVIEELVPSVPNFHYVFPLYDNYFIVTKNGELHWSPSIKFDTQCFSYPLFTQKPFNLACRNGYLIAYSSFQNVMVLKCQRSENKVKKPSEQDIIMIERQEIHSLFDKIKKIQSDFDLVQASTQLKLEEEKNNYENALKLFKNQYKQEILFINSKFGEISMQKLKQERQTQKVFENVETGQVKSLNELQKMYERKFIMQRQKYLNLQQSSLQQKMNYQKIILSLQSKYHKDVQKIRQHYQNEIQVERCKSQKLKTGHLRTKQTMQLKLYDLEEQNQLALNNIQENKDQIIKNLQLQMILMQQKFKDSMISCDNLKVTIDELHYDNELKSNEFFSIKLKLEESFNRKKQLQNEIVLKDKMLADKNQIIDEYQHQIAGLQKAKYVLNFRTTEIRKELQPKEALVDKLKSELFKIDDEYKNEKKNSYELNQRIQKLQKIHVIIKKQNTEIKSFLKHKQRIHDELCSEIFMIINTIDPKDWNDSFIKIYQSYIKEEKFKSRQSKKKDDTSEEINRHLIHVEQSLLQVSTGNDKILKGKEKDVVRKMKENSELVYQLNVMRKKEKEYQKQRNEMTVAYERLKRQINDQGKASNNNSTRAHTANTGKTRRIISRDGFSREKSNIADVSQFQNIKDKRREKSRISSAHKTLMFRDEKREKNNKFFQIAKQLQSARHTIKVQDQMIEELNHRLFGEQQK